MNDKFNQWLKSQDRIPVDAPPGHRCCEEAAREGWEACKREIVKWLRSPSAPSPMQVMRNLANQIDNEF